jgi:hypothetical protein
LTSKPEKFNLPRMRWAVLAIVTLFSSSAAGEPELLFTAEWGGDSGLEIAGGKESPVRGPTSVALDPLGNVWILDNLNNRLVGYDEKGRQVGEVQLAPGHRDDLAIGPDGSFALYSMHLRQIEILDRDGRPQGFLKLSPLLAPVGRISFPGEIEIENAHGERFRLGTPDNPRPIKQVLLGRSLECGIRVDAGTARLYTQNTTPLVVEGKRSYRIADLDLGTVASARPVTDCTATSFLIEAERLLPGTKINVEREVARVRDHDVKERWVVRDAWLYQPFRRFASHGDTAIMILPADSGLQVWRWRLR